jgi:muramoyltetrapeptide carboxypeptidase
LVPEFGEPEGPDHEVVEHWQKVTGVASAAGNLPAISWQSGESRMEADTEDRNMAHRAGEPRVSIRSGRAVGPLLAACLPSMLRLAGTKWWPELRGRILVIECPEEPYDLAWVDADLTHLRNIGVFDEIVGLAIGRTDNWTESDVETLHVLVDEATVGFSFPILAGVEVSHSAPLLTIPIGVQGTINGLNLSFDEPAVSA